MKSSFRVYDKQKQQQQKKNNARQTQQKLSWILNVIVCWESWIAFIAIIPTVWWMLPKTSLHRTAILHRNFDEYLTLLDSSLSFSEKPNSSLSSQITIYLYTIKTNKRQANERKKNVNLFWANKFLFSFYALKIDANFCSLFFFVLNELKMLIAVK